MLASARLSARSIWQAGVDAVKAEPLIATHVDVTEDALVIQGQRYPLPDIGKICVVGGGKAAGYLAAALEQRLAPIAEQHSLHGWINVPADCLTPTNYIRLHAGRPAGVNEPRPEGVQGTQAILQLVSSLSADDLCICLLTGGGSALLPAPCQGITLADKVEVTRLLSARGASIHELNAVRTALSDIKGGGLRQACRSDRLVTLVVSDVIGDPLEVIASGPTVAPQIDPQQTEAILGSLVDETELPAHVWSCLRDRAAVWTTTAATPQSQTSHVILANNEAAVRAACDQAAKLGFDARAIPPEPAKTTAEQVATELMELLNTQAGPGTCFIWGGEPVVELAAEADRGTGGRNQQLVLTALRQWPNLPELIHERLCVLSGGTDGEDGPTDAAGAFCDHLIWQESQAKGLDAAAFAKRNDAYTFFDQVDALIRTGPTHTNVCDLRIAVVQ